MLPNRILCKVFAVTLFLIRNVQLSTSTPLSKDSQRPNGPEIEQSKAAATVPIINPTAVTSPSKTAHAMDTPSKSKSTKIPTNQQYEFFGNNTASVKMESTESKENDTSLTPRMDPAAREPKYYSTNLIVTCDSVDDLLLRTPEWYARRDEEYRLNVGPQHYVDWVSHLVNLGETNLINLVWESTAGCLECDCEIGAKDKDHRWGVVPNPNSQGCDTALKADICSLIYNCMCEEFIALPEFRPRLSGTMVRKSRNIKNSYIIKLDPQPPQHGRPSGSSGNQMPPSAMHQMQEYIDGLVEAWPEDNEPGWQKSVSGIEEPYYLEGPTYNYGSERSHLAGLGDLGTGYGSKSSIWKREDSTVDALDDISRSLEDTSNSTPQEPNQSISDQKSNKDDARTSSS